MTYDHDPYERCRRSLERAQAEWDAMQPPDFYMIERDELEAREMDELDYIENAKADDADRRRDEA